jgi:hypothetical protein
MDPILARLATIERTNRRLQRILCMQALAIVALAALAVASCATSTAQRDAAPLRVTELVVTDSAGVARVRIGGELPDAIVGGKRVPRGGKAAGVLLYDAAGQERGGYVTWEPSGNVGLTLDGRGSQAALFVAGPDASSALQMWNGSSRIELRSDEDGSRMTASKDGQVVSQQPEIGAIGSEACGAYNDLRTRKSAADALAECHRRYVESACRACLGP